MLKALIRDSGNFDLYGSIKKYRQQATSSAKNSKINGNAEGSAVFKFIFVVA
jgi:hypothetical protein